MGFLFEKKTPVLTVLTTPNKTCCSNIAVTLASLQGRSTGVQVLLWPLEGCTYLTVSHSGSCGPSESFPAPLLPQHHRANLETFYETREGQWLETD